MITEKEPIHKIKGYITEDIKNRIPKNYPIAIAFSGGIDSVLLTKLIKNLKIANKIKLYVVGYKDSFDIISAEQASKYLKLKLGIINLDDKNLFKSTKELSDLIKDKNLVTISFLLPLFFVSKYSNEKTVVSGQGADTLFGGFNKFKNKNKNETRRIMNLELDNFINKLPFRENKIAKNFKKELVLPYTNMKLIKYVKTLPLEWKISNYLDKYILRKLALEIKIPEIYAYKPKKASQYGSGIMKNLKKMRKKGII